MIFTAAHRWRCAAILLSLFSVVAHAEDDGKFDTRIIAADHAIDEEMLVGLPTVPTAKTLPQPFLTNLYKRAPKRLREQAQRTTTELLRPPADIQATVDEMLTRLRPGDAVRGLQVFRGNKASCSACHRMGYIGKDVGPELTRIGGSRTPATLIEACCFPVHGSSKVINRREC